MDFLRSQLRLSLIVDLDLVRNREFSTQWGTLAEAGVSSLFFRTKPEDLTASDEAALVRITDTWRQGGGYVFAMDDAVLALKLGCHGVYVRTPRHGLTRMREVLGAERFIGVEINGPDTLERYQSEGLEHVDFAGIGPILQYGDKPGFPMGVMTARKITQSLRSMPVFWMGGIRAEDVPAFGTSFADGVAVVRALVASDVITEARRLHSSLSGLLGPTRWSVGHPPTDVNFQFTQLSPEDLKGSEVPLHRLNLA